MADSVVVTTNPTPQTLIIPQVRNPGVAQLLDWSGNPISATNGLPVTLTAGTIEIGKVDQGNSGTQAWIINLTQIAGSNVATGHGTAAGTLRVELPTDGTGVVGLNAGSNIIGATGSYGRVDVTPTVQNASYVSGNCIGGLISFTLPRTASGILQSVAIQFIGGATTAINAFLFDANPSGSTFTDKSTFTIVAADEAKRINKSAYSLTPVAATGDSVTAAEATNLARAFSSTGTIYLALCVTGTFTPASTTDLRVAIGFVQNPSGQ